MRFSLGLIALTAPYLVSAAPAKFKRVSETDILVLQFAEVLERLETQFYEEALAKFNDQDFLDAGITVPDVAKQNFQGILEHEKAHTEALGGFLAAADAKPIEGCTFNFESVLGDVATMAAVARVVEAVGVGAYLGASTLVEDKSILVAAASILTIEARHQSFLNVINGGTSVPQAFDIALTPPQVLALAGGFISGCSFPGLEANPSLTITNEGSVTPGTTLTFDSPALAEAADQEISCQMIVGGATEALSFPIADCVVPDNINGPVAIFLTKGNQPLCTDVSTQVPDSILAGPAIVFLDIVPDALAALVRQTDEPVQYSDEISQEEAENNMGYPVEDTYESQAPEETGYNGEYEQPEGGYEQPEGEYEQPEGGYEQPEGGYENPATESADPAVTEPGATPTDTAPPQPTGTGVPLVKVIGMHTIAA